MDPTEPQTATKPEKRSSPFGWLLAAGAIVLGKLKFLLVSLKFLSLGKFALTSLTMLTSIYFYAKIWGLPFAAGFVILILLHELGHGAAMKSVGVEAGWPIFIPFFGASISLKSMPRSAHDHAVIAYGGPLAGAAASLGCAAIGLVTHERFWLALAYSGFTLNLFNLIPVEPLDGGRVTSGISPRIWMVGAALLAVAFFFTHGPMLIVVAVLALINGITRSRRPQMTPMSDEEKSMWSVRYFGLCIALGAASYFTFELMRPSA